MGARPNVVRLHAGIADSGMWAPRAALVAAAAALRRLLARCLT